ncbi:rod shape-determining protein RodA [Halarsenatibacter silvermanii]|uniref:Cell elongation-specific peptidoglycan biosynthesis regulator RodA n=1 Tax=Halarsenatibacter silvermanii TaxID=321763 RepID=A0A1G9PD86_9FIRM|nr:rod shape-determining protein RodA [Halarsenatibacter silvermanii]SDL96115.1 cell elongation-specific peptidoglycan biosynthesis regulator RodA [Halarsenatibacter silvermanii]
MHLEKKLLKNLNLTIPLLVIALTILGLIAVSTAVSGITENPAEYLRTQLVAAFLGIILIVIIQFYDYRVFREYDIILYLITISILSALLFAGATVGGGTRWLALGPVTFQPSEIAKILLILFFASWMDRNEEELSSFKGFIKHLGYLLPPFFLVILQNDLGTALVLVFIFLTMFYIAGGRVKDIVLTFGGGFIAVVAMISSHIYFSTPLIFLQPYQLNRLIGFIKPEIDPRGIGYNIIQVRIAIGSGQFTGRGFREGPQNQLNFLPEQHTDFIFAVIGEEFGFIGAALVIILFVLLLLQIIKVALKAKDNFGKLITAGIIAMFFFHFIENVGMSLGIMPITGIPLPFISYGGSSMVTSMVAIGLILNINIRRKKINF